MNVEERTLLTQFLEQLQQANAGAKDPDAERLIREAVTAQPDAYYLLVQKALLQAQALQRANARIAALESRAQQPTGSGRQSGFLQTDPWSNREPAAPRAPGVGASSNMALPQPGIGQNGPGFGSFLGAAAATAAGVAGGAFLVQGIQHLFGSGSSGFGGGLSDSNSAARPEESVVNNYFLGEDNVPEQDGMQHAAYDPDTWPDNRDNDTDSFDI